MKKYSRLRAVIDLDAVMYNMEMMHANIEKGTKMVVVIKTDGYGHGAVPISRMLEDVDYVWGYAVATLDEGVVLSIVKPDVVLYEEGLDEEVLSGAVDAIRHADTLIIGGTSLVVYPAAGLIRYFRGDNLVVINMQPTGADASADLCIAKPIGQVLSEDVSLD